MLTGTPFFLISRSFLPVLMLRELIARAALETTDPLLTPLLAIQKSAEITASVLRESVN